VKWTRKPQGLLKENQSVIDYFALGRCASIALTIYFAFYEKLLFFRCFMKDFAEHRAQSLSFALSLEFL